MLAAPLLLQRSQHRRGTSRKARRVSWKWDPRIPASAQIMDECYGSAPKFSRGHMTRREDPYWHRRHRPARQPGLDARHQRLPADAGLQLAKLARARGLRAAARARGPDADLGLHRAILPAPRSSASRRDEPKGPAAPEEEFVFGKIVSPSRASPPRFRSAPSRRAPACASIGSRASTRSPARTKQSLG